MSGGQAQHDEDWAASVSAEDDFDTISRGLELARKVLAESDEGKRTQPARLVQARAQADDERIKALVAEPWVDVVTVVPTVNRDGDSTGMLPMPTMVGKEIFGTRLAFDLLAHCDNEARVDQIMNDTFAMIREPGHMFLVCAAALETIANHVVPTLLDTLENQASNFDARVRLADAARNAWAARVADLDTNEADR
jgi:hypothetical protein